MMADDQAVRDDQVAGVLSTIRLMMLGFSALFTVIVVALGYLGFKSLSDVGRITKETVEWEVSKLVEGTTGTGATLSDRTNDLSSQLDKLVSDINALGNAVVHANGVVVAINESERDPVGELLRLSNEMDQAKDLSNSELRRQAQVVFARLLKAYESGNAESSGDVRFIGAENLYNASSMAARLEMLKIASRLAQAAYELDPAEEHHARMLYAKARAGDMNNRDALDQILLLIAQTSRLHYVHHTLSEGFKIALIHGELERFLDSLRTFRTNLGDETPSFAWMIEAKAVSIVGTDLLAPIEPLRSGFRKLSLESPNALWFNDSLDWGREMISVLREHPGSRDSGESIQTEYAELLSMAGGTPDLGLMLNPDRQQPLTYGLPEAPQHDELVGIQLNTEFEVRTAGWSWLKLSEQTGGERVITATSPGGIHDPMLAVRDDSGELLAVDDDGGEGFNARLEFTTERGAEYVIGVGPAIGDSVQGTIVSITSE